MRRLSLGSTRRFLHCPGGDEAVSWRKRRRCWRVWRFIPTSAVPLWRDTGAQPAKEHPRARPQESGSSLQKAAIGEAHVAKCPGGNPCTAERQTTPVLTCRPESRCSIMAGPSLDGSPSSGDTCVTRIIVPWSSSIGEWSWPSTRVTKPLILPARTPVSAESTEQSRR